MATKICCNCKENLDVSIFMSNKKHKDGLQSQCKNCQKIYSREHYIRNKQKYVDKAVLRNKQSRQKFMEYKISCSCLICSEDNPACIDFHHLEKDDKKYNMSIIASSFGSNAFIEELKKCVTLCSNCHRKLHDGQFSLIYIPR